jgi:uncharacterized membrane protein
VLFLLAALVAAAAWGASDFSGALAQRKLGALPAVPGMLLVSAAVSIMIAAGTDSAPATGWLWGALAGMASSAGLVLLYRAFALGQIGIVASASAVVTGLLPIGFGLLAGERFGVAVFAGIALCFLAAIMLSVHPEDSAASFSWPPVLLALGAGLGFGSYLVMMGQVPSGASLWPVASGRIAGLVLLMVIFGWRSTVSAEGRGFLIAAGLLDAAANTAYLLASRGPLSEVGILAQLYPAATLILARFVLHEHLSRTNQVGVSLAILGPALITAGY